MPSSDSDSEQEAKPKPVVAPKAPETAGQVQRTEPPIFTPEIECTWIVDCSINIGIGITRSHTLTCELSMRRVLSHTITNMVVT